ncbi:kinase-like domain-containing protein [Lineolata rhizophorae]|uniref:Kinase-like domain-containing protein n=1 Tax=Lineolata rhizophorae TaxID=578093 RepID=A0A6A6P570_9PEZI|nr:kinase-like domain-containing protein [Lineolata rhizophorae]
MFRLGRASIVFNQLKIRVSPRPFFSSFPSSAFATTCPLPRRALCTMVESQDNLFDYTSGRWVYNDALHHKERKVAFDVDGLRRLAAESVDQNLTDVVSLTKLAEGGFNRTFVVALRGGRQVVARIPYPVTGPNYYAVASEVATIEYLRSRGIPAPEIYGYSADSDNAAGTPYILMEFVQGAKLSEVWPGLGDQEVISVKVAPGLGVPLEDRRFCVGPDTKLALWYGRRTELDVHRGPYQSAEAALAAPAHKEIAYLKRFGQPLLPLRRERRPSYKYQPQSPSYHVENLERYLSITSSLVPKDPALSRFCIRHPDLQPNNIFVSRSPDSGCDVVSLFDWQHTSILPNHGDSVSQSMMPPSLPENFNELRGAKRASEVYLYRLRLVHYHYVTSTKECNQLHYAAFTDDLYALRGRLFLHAGAPWEGESSELRAALIQATERWDELTGGGVPCPFGFDAKDLREMAELNKELSQASRGFEFIQSVCGVGEDGWVPTEDYEFAVASLKERKEQALGWAESAKEREEVMAHWPWDDMNEEMYM